MKKSVTKPNKMSISVGAMPIRWLCVHDVVTAINHGPMKAVILPDNAYSPKRLLISFAGLM